MRIRGFCSAILLLFVTGFCATTALAQSQNFDTSLHATRTGKQFFYGAENGGFELFTGVPIEELGCVECHGPTDANGNAWDAMNPYPGADCVDCHKSNFEVEQAQCLSCHGRQKTEAMALGYSDVHRDSGMVCWDCHTSGDLHGDGTEYQSMLEPGAVDVDCVDCHTVGPEHADYDPHNGAVHCTSCHAQTVISCYNCHFESQVESHVKRAKQPLHDFVLLVNREKDGKVYPATFQSLTYQGSAFAAFAPFTSHTITGEGRMCTECHQVNESNAAITQYNETGQIRFTEWDDTAKTLSWTHGIVPVPEDWETSLRMDFITYDGETSDPPGPSNNWSSIGKDTWDGSQMFFADPLTWEQMEELGMNIPDDMMGDDDDDDDDAHKVCLCHDPTGNNPGTICVDMNAVQAHVRHGDTLGPCENGNARVEVEFLGGPTPVSGSATDPASIETVRETGDALRATKRDLTMIARSSTSRGELADQQQRLIDRLTSRHDLQTRIRIYQQLMPQVEPSLKALLIRQLQQMHVEATAEGDLEVLRQIERLLDQ